MISSVIKPPDYPLRLSINFALISVTNKPVTVATRHISYIYFHSPFHIWNVVLFLSQKAIVHSLVSTSSSFIVAANMPGLVSATGVLGFLADEEPELKIFALQTLNDDIDTVWTEVAGALSDM